jgi:hypothetical protein
MRSIRFRVVLPIILGFLTLVLFAWDYQNDRVVASMGMGWDTGPPVWPYRAVKMLVYSINVPVFEFLWPIIKWLDIRTNSLPDLICFPAILMLWWWTGRFLDFGLLGRRSFLHRKLAAGILLFGGISLLVLAAYIALGDYHWFREYWRLNPSVTAIALLQTAGRMFWCLFAAGGFVYSAIRLIRREPPPSQFYPVGYKLLLFCAALLCVDAAGAAYLDRILSPPPDLNTCEFDRLYRLGCAHGTVVDASSQPVSHVQVDLIPTFKHDDARFYGTKSEWTDKEGRYNFNRVEPGEYLLAVNSYESSGGPDAKRPFATLYYPQTEDETGAKPIRIEQSRETNLLPMQLRRLEIATINVKVAWEDGARPERSNITFQNIRYLRAITNSSQVDNGIGRVLLPEGYTYKISASVECDGGKIIEQRESKAYQQITVTETSAPQSLTFVVPGKPCILWKGH